MVAGPSEAGFGAGRVTGAYTGIEYAWIAVLLPESFTWAVKVTVPVEAGVPESRPPAVKVRLKVVRLFGPDVNQE